MYARITDYSDEWPKPLWLIEVLGDGKYLYVATGASLALALNSLNLVMERRNGQ